MNPESATIAGAASPARGPGRRPAHRRPLREAPEDDRLGKAVEELGERHEARPEGLRLRRRDPAEPVPVRASWWQRSGPRGVTPCRRRSGSSASRRGWRSYSSAPRPWSRTRVPSGSPAAGRSRTFKVIRGGSAAASAGLDLLAQMLEVRRQREPLAEVLGGPRRSRNRGRASRARRGFRSARGSRST